jgi:hypothetical protein
MNFEDIKFPVYRKYKNNKSYFKIINPTQFEEVQLMGSRKIVKVTEASLFPEKMFIKDLVMDFGRMADEITEKEYEEVKNSTL